MKIEVNINRKFYLSVFVTAILLLGGAAVFAYNYQINSAANPSTFGHSVDEMDWSKTVPGNISAEGFCIGSGASKSCIKAWPSSSGDTIVSGGESLWNVSGVNAYYNAGNVTTTKYVKSNGICVGSDCVSDIKAVPVYRQAVGCGAEISFSAQCNTVSCKYSSGLTKLDGYYNCAGSCGDRSSQSCSNSIVGYLVN